MASHAIDELRKYYQALKSDSAMQKMQKMEKIWIETESKFASLIDDVSNVLGDVVFPFNKFTRRRAALRGSSLYLPGVIKAMTTEWNYKKIFSAKLAGGKRDHAVCFVLDISISMFGSLSVGLVEAIVVLMGALRKLEMNNIGILVFGSEVHLIKTSEQNWDTANIFILMRQLRFNVENDTRDADAIEVAIDLLDQSNTRGEKKIFIITDGYGNCGNRLALVQQRAEDHGIDLVAMAFGIDQTNLKSVYKRYLHCATVKGLPKALRSLFEQEHQVLAAEWPPKPLENRHASIQETKENLFESIESKKTFDKMIKELAGERQTMTLNSETPPTNFTVEICFCLDCTGSMSRWLEATKNQMISIIDSIHNLIQKQYSSLKLQLRFAIVAYRDLIDKPQYELRDFTENPKDITNFLNGLRATGGGDIPEDVLGALDQCLKMKWSETNARFIVLITDAPGHGSELNDNLAIDQHKQVRKRYQLDSNKNRCYSSFIIFLG